MKKPVLLKCIPAFLLGLLGAILTINTAFAITPVPGTPVYPTYRPSPLNSPTQYIDVIGGSSFIATWHAPEALTYQVWIKIPADSTATNATYFVRPKGNLVGNTTCSSTDAIHPCFEVIVDQATATNGWAQLMVNNEASTTWKFNKSGYVSVNANAISSSEQLGVAEVAFQQVIAPPPLAIGQNYQGGKIAYLGSTKQHGLIAASEDQSAEIQWYNGSNQVTGATGKAIGTGQANTTAIVTAQGAGSYAAKLCDDLVLGGYSDWYLPSQDELNKLIKNKSVLGGFADNFYWSSTEDGKLFAWPHWFGKGDGVPISAPKRSLLPVRCVRAF